MLSSITKPMDKLSRFKISQSIVFSITLFCFCITRTYYDSSLIEAENGTKGQQEIIIEFIDDTSTIILALFFILLIIKQLIVFVRVIFYGCSQLIFFFSCQQQKEIVDEDEEEEEENILLDADLALLSKTTFNHLPLIP